MGETSWLFLIIGSFAAVGAAMAVGTVAAVVRYRRTGTFPGSDEPVVLTTRRRVMLWVRIVVGVVLTIIGIIAIDRAGIF